MGQTKKRNYDRYTLDFKLQAVRMANHPDVMSKSIAKSLGIHSVMLCRWRMEYRRGELKEKKRMKPNPKSFPPGIGPAVKKEAELLVATKRIEELEVALANREEELDLLKKAQRFFAERKKQSSSSSRRTANNTK